MSAVESPLEEALRAIAAAKAEADRANWDGFEEKFLARHNQSLLHFSARTKSISGRGVVCALLRENPELLNAQVKI
jgi:hypothetical protein